ncbi:MAG TPA: glycosyltransferase family 2 protein [Chloroflexi bacterium]|nr:glycosyltransferase family 2 protein [Chloroflexota bacterium]HHW88989.1 glycosyltransferase family 2 protein [Chloroflexota bacterium]
MSPPVSVIVLSYNTSELTLTCLGQFAADAVVAGWQVIVVDNGSQDGTASAVAREFPHVEIVRSEHNRGFAGGNNLGLAQARGEAIILMNSDVLAPFSTLAALPIFLAQHPEVGALSPRLLTSEGAPQAFAFGNDPTLRYLLKRGLRRLSGSHPLHDWAVASPIEVDWVSGACMCVRRATMEQVGVLDDAFFLYFEDNDWCLRMRKGGWKVMYVPTFAVVHLGGRSEPERRTANRYYRDSLRYFYRKHYSPAANVLMAGSLWWYNALLRLRLVLWRNQ